MTISLRQADTMEDKKFLFDTRTIPEVCKMLLGPQPGSFESHLDYLDKLPSFKHIFIIECSSVRVGYCQLKTKTGEIGLVIHPESQGKGYGEEAIQALMLLAIERFEIKFLSLSVIKTNARAIELYQRCGFSQVNELGPIIRMHWASVLGRDGDLSPEKES